MNAAGGGTASVHDFRIALRGERVAFRVLTAPGGSLLLYAAPIDAGAGATWLNGGAAAGSVGALAFDRSGRRVVFTSHHAALERHALFQAPLDGSTAPLRLSPEGTRVPALEPWVDGGVVVFRTTTGLERVAIRGGESRPLLPRSPAGDRVWSFPSPGRLLRSGTRIAFLGQRRSEALVELFSVPPSPRREPR